MSFLHEVTAELAGRRLDTALVELEPELSRAQARRLIDRGDVTVGDAKAKASHRLRVGERIAGRLPEPEASELVAEDIPIEVLYEDRDLIVVDKPAGLVVHPAAGHRSGTLVNALLFHCDGLSVIGGVTRPGIVHRLDKGTSGVLVAAKNDATHRALSAQFKAHSIDREYLALVRGAPRAEKGSVDAPIARHPTDRKRFTTRAPQGARARQARTHWSVERRLGELTLLRVRLETGRTHQIRVHLASVGLPVVGDPVYGGAGGGRKLGRQALHAALLGFEHPTSRERVRFTSELAADLRAFIEELEA